MKNMPQEVEYDVNVQELKTWIKTQVLPTYRKNGTYPLTNENMPEQLFGALNLTAKYFPDSMSKRSIFNELIKQKKDAELHEHLDDVELLFNLLITLNNISLSEEAKLGVSERLYELLDTYSN